MKLARALLLGLVGLPVASAVASDDTTDVIQQLDKWDAAVAARDISELERIAADGYIYVEPDPTFVPPEEQAAPAANLQPRLIRRIAGDIGWADAEPHVQVTGATAIATGTYRLFKPGLMASGQPRLVAQGRFTTTWVKDRGEWRLLAEHRSLNDVQAWSDGLADSSRRPDWARQPGPDESPSPLIAAAAAPADAEMAGMTSREIQDENERVRRHRGLLPDTLSHVFRAYEPTQLGLTWDEGDDVFMDFSFSPMIALHGAATDYPGDVRRRTDERLFRPLRLSAPNAYFAATLRAGQYINTRPSSPVVGKRFNPLLAVRLWGEDERGARESMHNFFEISYGHESNGQFISSEQRFDEQVRVYRNQVSEATDADSYALALNTARASARDNISRGWDYVGVQFARDWDAELPWSPLPVVMGLNAKFHYYLEDGILQGGAEDYNAWENDPQGKPRSQTDGLTLRYTLLVDPWQEKRVLDAWQKFIRFERRYAFTWSTGYENPFKFNTLKAEATIMLMDVVPLTVWLRYGYNSDLIDYYRRDRSVGFSVSYWNF